MINKDIEKEYKKKQKVPLSEIYGKKLDIPLSGDKLEFVISESMEDIQTSNEVKLHIIKHRNHYNIIIEENNSNRHLGDIREKRYGYDYELFFNGNDIKSEANLNLILDIRSKFKEKINEVLEDPSKIEKKFREKKIQTSNKFRDSSFLKNKKTFSWEHNKNSNKCRKCYGDIHNINTNFYNPLEDEKTYGRF